MKTDIFFDAFYALTLFTIYNKKLSICHLSSKLVFWFILAINLALNPILTEGGGGVTFVYIFAFLNFLGQVLFENV